MAENRNLLNAAGNGAWRLVIKADNNKEITMSKFIKRAFVTISLILVSFTLNTKITFAEQVVVQKGALPAITEFRQCSATPTSICVEADYIEYPYAYQLAVSKDGSNYTVLEECFSEHDKMEVTGLTPVSSYYVKIRVADTRDMSVTGAWSSPLEVCTCYPDDRKVTAKLTNYTPTSLAFSWNDVDVKLYEVYVWEFGDDDNDYSKTFYTSETHITVRGVPADSDYSVSIAPVNKVENFVAVNGKNVAELRVSTKYSSAMPTGYNDYSLARTLQGVKGPKIQAAYSFNYLSSISWLETEPKYDCFVEFDITTYKNKKIKDLAPAHRNKEYIMYRQWIIRSLEIRKRTPYKVRSRYFTDVNGKRYYSKWSDYTYFSQGMYYKRTASVSGYKASWQKVPGAVKYIVYGASNPDKGYKKIGQTKKTSYMVRKINRKKLKKHKTYYIRVRPVVKFGRRKVTVQYGDYFEIKALREK